MNCLTLIKEKCGKFSYYSMICSKLMSNKFDFNKVTFEACSSNCLEYSATKIEKDIEVYSKSTGTTQPPSTSRRSPGHNQRFYLKSIVKAQHAIPEPRTIPGPYQSPTCHTRAKDHTRAKPEPRAQRAIPEPSCSTNVS